MIFHMDNFESYDEVKSTGNISPDWLSAVYDVRYTGITDYNTNLRVQEYSSGRIGLGNHTTFQGTRSVYLPLGSYFNQTDRVYVSQKLLDYNPNGTSILGISLVNRNQDDHLVSIGFENKNTGFVCYVGEDNVVKRDIFNLRTELSGTEDMIEWGFEKKFDDITRYGMLSIWINNKPAYTGQVLNQVGSKSLLSARVLGGTQTLAPGTSTTNKFINAPGNVSQSVHGITDLVVNNGQRNGLVRVLTRRPVQDISPNTMTPSESTSQHASIINKPLPSSDRYLVGFELSSAEMYGAHAFENMSNEAVLASSITALGSKNNPYSYELQGTIRVGREDYIVGDIDFDLRPRYRSIIMDRNPVNGAQWTVASVNNLSFGIKVKG